MHIRRESAPVILQRAQLVNESFNTVLVLFDKIKTFEFWKCITKDQKPRNGVSQYCSGTVRFLHSCAFVRSDHRSGLKCKGRDIYACYVWLVLLNFHLSTSLFQAYKTTGKQLSNGQSFAMIYLVSTFLPQDVIVNLVHASFEKSFLKWPEIGFLLKISR